MIRSALLVSYPLVLLDGLVAPEPGDLGERVGLEEALHDEVVALLPDRRLLGEARRDAVGNARLAAEITACKCEKTPLDLKETKAKTL